MFCCCRAISLAVKAKLVAGKLVKEEDALVLCCHGSAMIETGVNAMKDFNAAKDDVPSLDKVIIVNITNRKTLQVSFPLVGVLACLRLAAGIADSSVD